MDLAAGAEEVDGEFGRWAFAWRDVVVLGSSDSADVFEAEWGGLFEGVGVDFVSELGVEVEEAEDVA